ncbi:MAG: phosphoglucosamine mutase [Micrococcaceae bacterium]
MAKYFGTDGIRGLANGEVVNAELSLKVSQAAAFILGASDKGHKPKAVVARDPRASGEFITAAVQSGLASAGVDVHDAGVVPTPAAAYLVADDNADFGVMISASHNPAPDNGIKFLARGGQKLHDAIEEAIEAKMKENLTLPTGDEVGRITRFADAEDRYVLHLLSSMRGQSLKGLKIVVDCANGAASGCSPQAFKNAGADITVIGAEPDGLNINKDCGSTHMEKLQEAVVRLGADMGFAHDGDADRCLAVDHEGKVIDGDQIMLILALSMKDRGVLKDNVLVGTVMSNLGLKIALKENGIELVQTQVGDRYVLEAMRNGEFSLGGEQSGHVIMSEYATTGDGVLTGLHLAAEVARTGKSLQELANVMQKLPQVLINVKNVDKSACDKNKVVLEAVEELETELGDTGRVLLRPSGTEPLVRVMVEAGTEAQARQSAKRLAKIVESELSLDN